MRIVAGEWRGRTLAAPPGHGTRPTADRVRQALFDMLLHAPWGGRDAVEGARVLDAFAGSGALGLEALSRGAAHATFFEPDRAALGALRANVARCGAEARSTIVARDVLTLTQPSPSGRGLGEGYSLVFLDPPYGQSLIPRALARLRSTGWLTPGVLIIAETGHAEASPLAGASLAERIHGAARLTIWREG